MSNLGQIRSLTRIYISQVDTGNTDFSDDTLNGFINEGQRFLGALVKKPIDHVTVQAQEDYPAYTLPNDAILLNTAYFGNDSIGGDVRPLSIITEEALKEVSPNWLDSTASSQGRPMRIILLDRRTVLVNPRPNAAESLTGKKIFIGYVYQPSNLVNDSDTPDLPIVYHDLMSQYAQQMCLFSKLNNPVLGAAILQQVIEKAKKLEPLIIKESNSLGFSWGQGLNPNLDSTTLINP